MEKLYRIEEMTTIGWELAHENAVRLTKEQAKAYLEELIAEGCNPNRLRAIPDA